MITLVCYKLDSGRGNMMGGGGAIVRYLKNSIPKKQLHLIRKWIKLFTNQIQYGQVATKL